MRTNRRPKPRTHEGARAAAITPLQQLHRSVLSCLLWEDGFYESGVEIGQRILGLVAGLPRRELHAVAELARRARTEFKLRHAPLLLVSALAKRRYPVRKLVSEVVQRADELAELLSIHCLVNGVGPDQAKKVLGAQLKRGLADAFGNFDAYQLAKYKGSKNPIKLRDVMFLAHPKPRTPEQEEVFRKLADGTLDPPDTWEVHLSAGKDKKETFERLLREGRLGYLALLRNLRNMVEAGVDRDLVRQAILARRGADRVLPFRFVAAARHAPEFKAELGAALVASLREVPPFDGETVLLVDVSGSMDSRISGRSELSRMTVAAALGAIFPGRKRVFTFSSSVVEVEPDPEDPFETIERIVRSQGHWGTMLGSALGHVNNAARAADRLVVITDEQSHDEVPQPAFERAYMINVAPYQNGVGYGRWVHIDGFSENVLKFIHEYEREFATAAVA